MRRFALYLGIAAGLVASCSTQEKDFQTPQEDVIYYSSFEQPAEEGTRVYANEDLLLRWTADDRVSIFGKNTYNQQYKFLGETGDNSGGFSKVDGAEYVTGNPISHTVSVYPYQASTKITEDEVLTVTLPAEQYYAENTFGLGANTMVSVSEDNFLQYKNVGGYLMLKLYGESVSVSSITLKGNNGEKLAGKATVTMPLDGVPSVTMASDAGDMITLTCSKPVQLGSTEEEDTQFWFVIPPVTFSKGFTIIVNETTGGSFEKSTSKQIVIERNKLSKMSPMEVDVVMPVSNIVFADEKLKAKLVAAFDKNSDGELSYGEAAIVSSIDGVFGDEKEITSFDEFKFFTGVTAIPNNTFSKWHLLSSIELPESIITIGSEAFSYCDRLKTISIPRQVQSIEIHAFYECTNLEEIVLPSSLSYLGPAVFRECSSLQSVTIPEGIVKLSSELFYNCTHLSSFTIPESVETIESTVFSGCESLTSLVIPNNVRTIGLAAFQHCSGLKVIELPSSLTRLEEWIFIHCSSLESITIPESVMSIGKQALYGCSALNNITVQAHTPPLGQIEMFFRTNNCPINVPAESVDAYKSAQYWIDYADRIRALPEAVDLGLSVKWASFNLGASKPEEYGDYYAWGETEPYYSSQDPLVWKTGKDSGYSWKSYMLCMGYRNTLTKYCHDSRYGYNGFTDNKTVLDLEDDAANVNLGGKWRMPTDAEWVELINSCNRIWTTQNGVEGRLITASNGNSIFLPAAGSWKDTNHYEVNINGLYWSSTLNLSPISAWSLFFYSGDATCNSFERRCGFTIRPVLAE